MIYGELHHVIFMDGKTQYCEDEKVTSNLALYLKFQSNLLSGIW